MTNKFGNINPVSAYAPQPAPTYTVTAKALSQAELDEQNLAKRVKELTRPTILRPALIDPAEVSTARQKFKSAAGVLQAIEIMASIRIVWLNQRDGLTLDVRLNAPQKEAAARFFNTHSDAPLDSPDSSAFAPALVPAHRPAPVPVAHSLQNGGPGKVGDKVGDQVGELTFALAHILVKQNRLWARISDTLDQIAATISLSKIAAPAAPNFRRPYADFQNFDWTSIGAVVTARDGDGVSAVEWNGYDFTRRAGVGKYGKVIWFSRSTGQDAGKYANGNQVYARLITFKDATAAEPLPKK